MSQEERFCCCLPCLGSLPSIQKTLGQDALLAQECCFTPFLSLSYTFGYHCSTKYTQGMIPHTRFQNRKQLLAFTSVRQPLICRMSLFIFPRKGDVTHIQDTSSDKWIQAAKGRSVAGLYLPWVSYFLLLEHMV